VALVDIILASSSIIQFVLSVSAAYIAFTLRKTFEGGIFEGAWRVVGFSPLFYAAGQAIELAALAFFDDTIIETLAGVLEVTFILVLVYGLYRFASAWRPPLTTPKEK
jgi:hypothetical protein